MPGFTADLTLENENEYKVTITYDSVSYTHLAQQMVLDLEGKINLDLEDAPAQSKAKVAEENQALEEAMERCV